MKKVRGYTLVEAMTVLLIFTLLFGALLSVLLTSDLSWRKGQEKLQEQQQARILLDKIVRLLRAANLQDGITIGTPEQDRILFYVPVFDSSGVETGKTMVIFKPDPDNPKQIIVKNGADWVPVAQDIESLKFSSGGCAGCACFSGPDCGSCITVTDSCRVVKIEVKPEMKNKGPQENTFALISYATVRNYFATEPPEPPAEGEF